MTGSSQITKRCHWVPQAYLRTFAADSDRRKIWRLSKEQGDPELKRIENVAVKFHLYAPKGADGRRDDSLEKKLAELEQWLGMSQWQEACWDFPDFADDSLRKFTALIAATMWLRTPSQFEHTKWMHSMLVRKFKEAGEEIAAFRINGQVRELDTSNWDAYRNATDDDLQRFWNGQVSQAGWMAELLTKMRWAILFSEEPLFITSDNPVMVIHPSLRFRGLKNPETTVIFPLSPTRILMMDHRHSEPDARYYPLQHHPSVSNGLIWRNAFDHMFSPRHPDLVCAEIVEEAERMGYG